MAKLLAFKRPTSEVVTVDTINNRIAVVGAALPNVVTTSSFPGRTENNIAVFRGDPYFLYLHTSGSMRLAVYQSGVWSDVAGFTYVTGSGTLTPIAVHVVQDWLVGVFWRKNSAGVDGIVIRRSQDGIAWSAVNGTPSVTQPLVSDGGHSIVWRNAIFVATADGIVYYDVLGNSFGTYDSGDDTFLTGSTIPVGNFCFWNNELYFVKPNTVPTIYQLDSSFDPAGPPPSPMWTNRLPTGIPGLGTVTVGPDTGTFLLFVNKLDELCLLYSAQLGTKLIKSTAALFPLFDDVTNDVLDTALSTALNRGFTLFVDDRRSVNELQSFMIRNPSGDTQLASWDGANKVLVRTTFVGIQLMTPDDRFGALRTFTDLQPTSHIRSTTQPFPGRVVIDYTVRDASARPVDVFGEYSLDGDQWLPMTQGDGDDGNSQLVSSFAGVDYQFFWDAFADLDGDFDFMNMRIVARISGV